VQGYHDFLKLSDRLHRVSNDYFFWKSIGGISDMIDFKAGFSPKILGDVWSMRMGRSVSGTVRKYVPDPRVAQMLDHFVQYVGSCPESSPAVLCGIAHMQTQEGIWFPIGGTRAVPEALVKLGRELGVEYRTGIGVSKIELYGEDQVRSVVLDNGESIECAAVVSNADSVRTHRELLNGRPARVSSSISD
jgi:diapolycopene oxygenase